MRTDMQQIFTFRPISFNSRQFESQIKSLKPIQTGGERCEFPVLEGHDFADGAGKGIFQPLPLGTDVSFCGRSLCH